MTMDIHAELARLGKKSTPELLVDYQNVFGRPSASRNKTHLTRQIVWGLQAEGRTTLSQPALRRVSELVDPHDLRVCSVTHQRGQAQSANRDPIPGTIISRMYKGDLLEVEVLTDGFRFQGQRFGSLSALARHITGSRWNGNLFFGIQSPSKRRKQ